MNKKIQWITSYSLNVMIKGVAKAKVEGKMGLLLTRIVKLTGNEYVSYIEIMSNVKI